MIMRWDLETAKFRDRKRIVALLLDGWEPFAVGPGDDIYFRRQTPVA